MKLISIHCCFTSISVASIFPPVLLWNRYLHILVHKVSTYGKLFLSLGMFTHNAPMEGNPRFLEWGDVRCVTCSFSLQNFCHWLSSLCCGSMFRPPGIAKTWQQWIKMLHKPICERKGEGIIPGNIEQPSPHLYCLCQQLLLVITSGMSSCCFSSNLFVIHHKSYFWWSSTFMSMHCHF